jgi:hypothetical protein
MMNLIPGFPWLVFLRLPAVTTSGFWESSMDFTPSDGV